MLSANRDSFTSSFPVWMLFVYFSCPSALARTSSTVLNRSGETDIFVLFLPVLREKAFSLSLLSMMWIFVNALYQVDEVSFYS